MTIDSNITKPIYDNNTCSITHPPFDLSAVKFHDKRLNFAWKKIVINRG